MSEASKTATAFRVSPSLFMSQRGLTAVLVVTALLITAGIKLHPAAGYKSCLLPISADPGFNRRLSGGQPAAQSEGTGLPVGPTARPALRQALRLEAVVGAMLIGMSTVSPLNGPLVFSSSPSIHPLTLGEY